MYHYNRKLSNIYYLTVLLKYVFLILDRNLLINAAEIPNITANIILDISKILEENKISYVIKPHPSDDLRIFKKNKHIYLGDKGSLIPNNARIMMGFVIILL